MSTTCQNCHLQLAVTPADLRAGQGYVRCSRCERIFNALLWLTDDADEQAPAVITEEAPADVPAEEETPPPLAIEALSPSGDGEVEAADLDIKIDPVADEDAHIDISAAAADVAADIPADDIATGITADIGNDIDTAAAQIKGDLNDDFTADFDAAAARRAAPRPRAHWGWTLAAAALGLALLVQLVHHNRQSLIMKSWAAPLIAPIYAAFGHPLTPDWNLTDYTVRQLGAQAPPFSQDLIVVRASVLNSAPYPQPPPVLRVTLQDRFGNTLATHDVPPQDYLRTEPPPRLSADQRLDAELVLDDPGSKAVGFALDACLPSSAGRLVCASVP
ncbi:MAG: zinc-ribbon and DUF3426 domain-containing protein [Nevskiaceae bacterium]|nr:zinc-ribbon and DUF3426 domain-containing protein [Nevskiaceae bacterium]